MKYIRRLIGLVCTFTVLCINMCFAQALPQTAVAPGDATITQPGAIPEAPPSVVGYIFVGDSRLKGIDLYGGLSKNNPDIWSLSKVSRNYNYLKSGADKDIKAIQAANPLVTKWYEVYCLGVNDMGNLSKYTSWYQNRALTHNVILVSVPPTKKSKKIPNSSIESFNASLVATGIPYMDLYTYLSAKGVVTGKDGIHYAQATCQDAAVYMAQAVRILGR